MDYNIPHRATSLTVASIDAIPYARYEYAVQVVALLGLYLCLYAYHQDKIASYLWRKGALGQQLVLVMAYATASVNALCKRVTDIPPMVIITIVGIMYDLYLR